MKCFRCLIWPLLHFVLNWKFFYINISKTKIYIKHRVSSKFMYVAQCIYRWVVLTDVGERPYQCPVDGCSKAFRQLSSLQQHLKGHNIPLPKSYPVSRPMPRPPPPSIVASPSSGSPSSAHESSAGNKVRPVLWVLYFLILCVFSVESPVCHIV